MPNFYLWVRVDGTCHRLLPCAPDEVLTRADLKALVGGKPKNANIIGAKVVINENQEGQLVNKVMPQFRGDIVLGRKTEKHAFAGFPSPECRAMLRDLSQKR